MSIFEMKAYLTQSEAIRFINRWIWRHGYWQLFDKDFRRSIIDCSSLPRLSGGLWAKTKFAITDLRAFCDGELLEFCESEKGKEG